jgi:hypothetical protein
MATIFDIDYTKTGKQLTPPDKRQTVINAWVKCLLAPMQWLADLWLKDYRVGSTAALWIITTNYGKYDRVKYKFAIYESLAAANLGNLPTDLTKWKVVQKNFIGVTERILYTGLTLTLTYALNKRFDTIFRQPPTLADIYISNNVIPFPPFIVGGSSNNSSSSFSLGSTEFVIDAYSFTNNFNFTIHVPVATYNALDPLPANRDKIFRSFVDGIIPAGITYNIVTF